MAPVVLIFLFIIFYLLSSKPSLEQQADTKITPSYSDRVIPMSTFPSQAKEGVFDAKAQERQDRGEKAFAKSQSDISKNYPWYDQLPIKSADYFVFFDVDKKSFTGNLYPASTNKNFIVSQVVKMKARIRKSLADLSIDYTKYPFIWNIKPENKKIIGAELTPIDKRPGLTKKESFNSHVTNYTFTSSLT